MTPAPTRPRSLVRRLLRLLSLLLASTFLIGLLFQVGGLYLAHREAELPMPFGVGNFERNLATIEASEGEDEDASFRFAVVGDFAGYGVLRHSTFDWFLHKIEEEPPEFLFLLGDGLSKADANHHRYLRWKWKELYKDLPFPVLYVIGNHEIHGGDYTIPQFEETYGPTLFSFEFRGNLFIGLRALPWADPLGPSIDYLEQVLGEGKREKYKRVFVMMHAPVHLPDGGGWTMEEPEALLAALLRLEVDYVFCGSYHVYSRDWIQDTAFVVTGGGGQLLEPKRYSAFHHAMLLDVEPDRVRERLVVTEKKASIWLTLVRLALVKIYPSIREIWGITVPANALLLLLAIYGVIRWRPGRVAARAGTA